MVNPLLFFTHQKGPLFSFNSSLKPNKELMKQIQYALVEFAKENYFGMQIGMRKL